MVFLGEPEKEKQQNLSRIDALFDHSPDIENFKYLEGTDDAIDINPVRHIGFVLVLNIVVSYRMTLSNKSRTRQRIIPSTSSTSSKCSFHKDSHPALSRV